LLPLLCQTFQWKKINNVWSFHTPLTRNWMKQMNLVNSFNSLINMAAKLCKKKKTKKRTIWCTCHNKERCSKSHSPAKHFAIMNELILKAVSSLPPHHHLILGLGHVTEDTQMPDYCKHSVHLRHTLHFIPHIYAVIRVTHTDQKWQLSNPKHTCYFINWYAW
jgi:hypothetical protein